MHISEGVLSPPVLISGATLSAIGIAIGLKKMDTRKIPQVAIMSSAFFVASLIHVPIGPANAHLVMNGLVGVILGWMSFPSIVVALSLQALIFQFGGFTVLGVNTFIMAMPAVIAFYLFRWLIRKGNSFWTAIAGFLAGVAGVGLGVLFLAIALVTTGEAFLEVAGLIAIAHLPILIAEGVITSFVSVFLKKVKPEILEVYNA
jgi:cobalt/nickel transport system permease protein